MGSVSRSSRGISRTKKKYKPQANEAEEKTKQLITIDSAQIQDMEIERLTNGFPEGIPVPPQYKPIFEKTTLRKAGIDWNILSPIQDAADSGVVASMITSLTTTKQDRIVDDKPKDLSVFGLKTPAITVRVRKTAASPAETLLIGSNTPVGYNSYAKMEKSDTVYRIPRSLRTALDKPLKDIRNKNILQLSHPDVAEVDLQVPKNEIILKKDDVKDEWTLAREGIPVDNAEWNKTLNPILELRATDFPAIEGKTLKDFSLSPAKDKIVVVRMKDKTKISLLLGAVKAKDKTHVYAKREDKDTVYEVDPSILTKIERPATDYRSKQIAKFDRFGVVRVRLDHPDTKQNVEIVREGAGWQFPSDAKTKIDNGEDGRPPHAVAGHQDRQVPDERQARSG